MKKITAVVFDVGGVLVPSPFPAISRLSTSYGLSPLFFSQVIRKGSKSGNGSWERLERGQLSMDEFDVLFGKECLERYHELNLKEEGKPPPNFSGKVFLDAIMNSAHSPRPLMMELIKELKEKGYKVGVITNNWKVNSNRTIWDTHEHPQQEQQQQQQPRPGVLKKVLNDHVDVLVESCVVGVRKPNVTIYTHCLHSLNTPAHEAVFLDDIGANLRAAKSVGMETILVKSPKKFGDERSDEEVTIEAIQNLQQLLGIQLRVLNSRSRL